MTLKKKTNRNNARASTGPKTADGKVRAAQNAFRHELSLAVGSSQSNQVEALAQQLIGETTNFEILERASRVVAAQVDVRRIRARYSLMASIVGSAKGDQSAQNIQRQDSQEDATNGISELAKKLLRINRYERRALSRRKFAIRALDLAYRKVTDAGNSVAVSDLDKCDRKKALERESHGLSNQEGHSEWHS